MAAADKAFASDPNAAGDSAQVLTVRRPAEIVNYGSTGSTPVVLAGGLAVGAAVAMGMALFGSVRRRRRELALLKTLGFTRRQVVAAVTWHASVVAAVGLIVGVALGIALGRQLWIVFARQIYVVPEPAVPWSIVLIALMTMVLANIIASGPGLLAGRTSPALTLRAE
ncbi:MAG TPA: FtsX-like permease family protein [Acidimicrobiales bacterium]|nr:FtsX-like permease family protein [Acidimicrobiales bacterium]